MKEHIKIEHSIHYASNESSNQKVLFNELTPMFIGYQTNPKPNIFGPHKRFSYVIHFVNAGEGFFTYNDVEYRLKKGDVFIVKPYVSTYYRYEQNNNLEFAWIGFTGTYPKKLDTLENLYNLSQDYYKLIKQLVDNQETVYSEPVVEILISVINEILNQQSNKIIIEVKEYLDKNYNKPITIEEVAKKFAYNRIYLSQIFKKHYNVSPKEYLMNKRLSESINLILEGKKILEVSNLIGFSNQYNFSRYFKAKYGVPPSEYIQFVKK